MFQWGSTFLLISLCYMQIKCHAQPPCQTAECILSKVHSEKMQFYAKISGNGNTGNFFKKVTLLMYNDNHSIGQNQESNGQRSLLREYLNQLRLRPSSNLGLNRQNMEEIRNRLQNLNVHTNNEKTTTKPPYLFEDSTSSELPPSNLATLIEMTSLFR